MIQVKIIADSIHNDSRLTTMECTFHRFILPEFNTYRMWSRNAASSRALSVKKKIEEVRTNPATPVEWGRNQPGMVAEEVLSEADAEECHNVWLEAASAAADYAQYLASKNVHKQIVNRVLEPFLWHTSVVSSVDWSNMFTQRIHSDAQPEFRELAILMKNALDSSQPRKLTINEWHLPYLTEDEKILTLEIQRKISVARIARTSYLNQGEINVDKDTALYDRLVSAKPPHLSPFEMVARPLWIDEEPKGNFPGWRQLRHGIEEGIYAKEF